MSFTARVRSAGKPISRSLTIHRLTRPLDAAIASAARGAGMLKPLAVLCLVGALVGGLLVPAIASAETAPPPMSSLIVKLVPALTPAQQAAVIARNGGIEVSTIPALRLHVISIPTTDLAATLASYQADPQVQSAEENKTRQSETMPTDPLYPDQWYLPQVKWDLVFGTVTPTGTATVAILDTGIDNSHPDLGSNVLPGTSILDGSNGLSDPSGHGTWMAGIVAAQTNTIAPEGIAGVAYAGVRMLPVTVLDSNGLGQDSDVIAGVIWAADHGADVILMGFSNPGFSPNLQDAIDYAWSKGVILVAATGNGGANTSTFPAGDRGVIGVSATDATDSFAGFSNYGQAAFLAAPGTNIQTTNLGWSYTVISGTSASAAIVAGSAALLKAVDPSLTNGVIVGRLARMADPAGTQEQTGNGRINLARALADTGTDFIEPAGADPVGAGGPFVGPYVAAARNLNVTFAGAGGGSVAISVNLGIMNYPTTGSGACPGATGDGTASVTIVGSCNLNLSNNSAVGTLTATPNGTSAFGGWTVALGTCSGNTNPCSTGSLGGGQNPVTVTFNSKPTTTSISPTSKVVGETAFTLTVNGTNFQAGAVVQFNGSNRTTSSSGSTQRTASILTSDLTSAGTFNITVVNPDGGTSNAQTFTVNQASSTTTVTCPASVTYTGGAQTPCTASVTGVGGLNQALTVSYSNNVNTGTATASATFAGDANHIGSSDSKTFAITQASSTTTVTFEAGPYTYRATAFTATAQVTGVGGLNTAAAVVYSGDCTNVTNANGCTATATFAGDTNHTGSTDSKSITITKASSTTTVTFEAGPYTYRGTAFTATAQVTGVGGLNSAVAVVYSGDCVNVTGANGCTATATFAGDTNHTGSSDAKSITITQATSTTTVTFEAGPYTYRATAFTATAQVTGVGGLNSPVAVVYSGDCTNVTGANGCTATATFAGDTNHVGSSDSKSITITQAASATVVTFEAGPYTYRSTAFTATAAVTGVGGLNSSVSVVYSGDCTNVTGANGCTATATFASDPNHTGSSDAKSITIDQASSATVVTCPTDVPYTGAAQTPCSASVTGVGGLSQALSVSYLNNINAGTATASASYPGDANHTGSSDSKSFTIDQASTTTVVVAGTTRGTYTATVSPVAPATTVPTGTVQFRIDGTPIGGPVPLDGSGQATSAVLSTPETAGSHTIAAQYSGDTNYTTSTGTLTDTASAVADQAYAVLQSATLTVSAPGVLGNDSDTDSAQSLQAFVTQSPAQGTLTLNPDGSFTYLPAGLGVFTFKYSVFDGVLYSPEATVTITVLAGTETPVALNDAYSVTTGGTLTVPAASGVLANDHGQTLSVVLPVLSGVRHGTLTPNGNGGFTYQPTAGFTGVDSFLYQATDGANPSNVAMVTITVLAAADTDAVDDYYLTTDGTVSGTVLSNDHGAPSAATVATGPLYGTLTAFPGDGTFTYAPGLFFAGVDSFTYRASGGTNAGNLATVTIRRPDLTVDAPAVTYNNDATVTVTVTFPGLGAATGAVVLSAANATVAAPTTVTLDGNGQATFTVTQPTAADSPHALTAVYTTADYTGSSTGSGSLTVNKAPTTTVVTFEAGPYTYRASAFTATAAVTGVGGLNQAVTPVVYTGDCTNVTGANGCTATATFAGDTNHLGSSDSQSITITQAASATVVTFEAGPYTYRASAFTATAAVTGVGGLNQAVTPVVYTGDCTNVTGANGCTATATFAGDTNHAGSSDSQSITITQAASATVVTFEAGPYTYRASAFTATAQVTGVGGLNSAVAVVYSGDCVNVTGANGCTATATFAGDTNHLGSNDSKSITITQAASATVVTFEAGPYTYRATAFTATAAVTGVGGLNSPVAVVYSGDCVNVTGANGCTATATFAGDTNHAGSSDSKSITITQAASATVVTFEAGPYTYRSTAFTATAAVTGVGGLNSSVSVVYSGDCTNVTGANGCTATATFAGDTNHLGSSDSKSLTINPAATSISINTATLTNNPNPSVGVTVTSSAGVPGGPITLKVTDQNNNVVGTQAATLSSGTWTFVVSLGTDGIYTIAADYAAYGNYSESVNTGISLVLDRLSPDTVIDSGPVGMTLDTNPTFTFHSSDPSGDTFECSLDGATFAPCNTAAPSTPSVSYAGPTPGPHTFRVRAKDGAGNVDAAPASRTWIIGSLTNNLVTMDESFKNFDGFDVMFGKGTGTWLKIANTNPKTFHFQMLYVNNTGMEINTAGGGTTTAIVEVPGMPPSCGPSLPCVSHLDPAFAVKNSHAIHIQPGGDDWDDRDDRGDRDDRDDRDDVPITVQYMTLAGYQANSNSCAITDNASYSSTKPADGAAKCIKISGFAIPKKHKARIRISFEFRPKGTDGWNANAKLYFFAGFPFKSATTVTFGSATQTSIDAAGLVGAGSKMTAVGGFVLNSSGIPRTGYNVRVFKSAAQASCTVDTNLVAQDVVDATGFYFIWRSGSSANQESIANGLLPSGVQYAVQVCNGATPLGIRTTDSKLKNQEFEQVDFYDLP